MSVSNHILRLSSAKIPRWRLDLAITVLMLRDSDLDISLAYDGLRKRRYKMATLRSANPRDGRGKWSCYRWCLTNMRSALDRAQAGPYSVSKHSR